MNSLRKANDKYSQICEHRTIFEENKESQVFEEY